MTQCNSRIELGILDSKEIVGDFDGGLISSDGGLMLLKKLDEQLGLTERLAAAVADERDPNRIKHPLEEMFAQRIYQIACGYEDCNDADQLRSDPVFKTAAELLPETDHDLASQPTLCRLENSVDAKDLRRMAQVLVDLFIASHSAGEPREIVLDFDATEDPTHGGQQLTFFNGFYDHYCYLPLIVTAQVDGGSQQLLTTLLRSGKAHASHNALGILKRLVARFRQAWPQVRIIFRADSGFASPDIYNWCEANGVEYLIGLITNSRLLQLAEPHLQAAQNEYEQTQRKVRNLQQDMYAARSWPHLRRVLIKAEINDKGQNCRFVVTNINGSAAESLYNKYAQRGDPENRIKELKNDLQIDRTSCHRFFANQFRLFLHAAAFVLFDFLRRLLYGTQWAKAQVSTLQRDLVKLGVRVKQTARRVWLHFASACPVAELWPVILQRLEKLA